MVDTPHSRTRRIRVVGGLVVATLAAIEVTGAEVADWLERAATIFAQLPDDGDIHPLIDPSIPGFQFDIIAGLDYRINLSRPAAFDIAGRPQPHEGRIEALQHAGRNLRAEDRFLLVTNSYRMCGGPLYAPLTAGKTCRLPERARLRVRDLVARYLRKVGEAPLQDTPFFHFSARPGTHASFDTAAAAIPADCPLDTESLGLTEFGFQRLILKF